MFSTLRSASALLAIVSLVLFVASGQLLAADEAGAEGKGLLTQETEIFIYTIVVFLIAFLILQKKAWGPIAAALDERESKIRESLEAADRMRRYRIH